MGISMGWDSDDEDEELKFDPLGVPIAQVISFPQHPHRRSKTQITIPSMSEVSCSRRPDSTSALLLTVLLQRRCLRSAEIVLVDKNHVLMHLNFKDILLSGSSSRFSSDETGGEQFSIHYQHIGFTTTTYELEPLSLPLDIVFPEKLVDDADPALAKWEELSEDVLALILQRLSTFQLFQFGFSCKYFAKLASNRRFLRVDTNSVGYYVDDESPGSLTYNDEPLVDYKGASVVFK